MTARPDPRAGAPPARRFLAVVLCIAAASSPALAGPAEERGAYVFRAAGCAACHTDIDAGGALLAGGRGLETPFGTFYAPNITPDAEHGIGGWSEQQFVAAVTAGVGPDGQHYYPVFPYPSYAAMRVEDARDLWAYLRTVEPVATPDREHDLPWFARLRLGNWVWNLLFFDPDRTAERPDRSAVWNRGAYLVNALGHCAECHSPRNLLGAIDPDLRLAGTLEGPEGAVPNITPDPDTGIGDWTRGEVAEYLASGLAPDGDYAGGAMVEVIDEGTSHLTPRDRDAIVEYLLSLPPVVNRVEKEDEEEDADF